MNAGSPETPTDLTLYATALRHAANAIALCEAVRTDDGVIVDFRYLLLNQRYEELAGRTSESVRGQLASVLFPNTLTTGLWQRAAEVMLSGNPHRQQLPYTTSNQYTGWFDVTVSRWDDRGVVISIMEVSDQKARLLAERQQAELLQRVINESLNGLWVLEAVRNAQRQIVDFRFRLANRAGSVLNGYTPEQLGNTTLLTLFPATNLVPFPDGTRTKSQTIFGRYVDIVETGEPVIYDVNYQHDGLSGWYWIAVSRLNDGLIVTFLDISDLKYTQQQLERTIRELKQTNQNLEQFAYVASHDLQEPLRKIQSFGGLLTDRLGNNADETVADIVRRMQASAQRMQSLVKDLLAYSRLTARHDGFGLVALSRVLTDALDDLQPMIEEERAVIESDLLPIVSGDPAQLRQLFFCLINNALKFHQPGAVPQVTITSAIAETDELPPVLTGSDHLFVAVSVADTGIGFDEKYLDRIFTIFQRLHGRGRYDGTGIGLAIARKVAENHGGTLTARSRPGQGSVFTVWLPVS